MKLAVTALVLDFVPELRVCTWERQTRVPLALVGGEPLIQRTLRQLDDALVSRIIVLHSYEEVRRAAKGARVNRAEVLVGDKLEAADHPRTALSLAELDPTGAVLIVAADVAFADGLIGDFISDQISTPSKRRCLIIEEPHRSRKEAASTRNHPALCFLSDHFSPSLLARVKRGEPIDLHDAKADEIISAPVGRLKSIRDGLDLEIANFLVSSPEARYQRLSKGSGGYWSRPIAEHLLLCNSFFPPTRFFDRISERLQDVLSFYPSTQEHLARLVALMTGQVAECILVGNGVSDIIQALYAVIEPRIAIATPTFDGFQIALPPDRVSCFELPEPFFDLEVDKFGAFALERAVTAAVVVNPNNPSGRLVEADDLRRLARVLQTTDSTLIVDESFIDFPHNGPLQSLEPYLSEL